jgi:hypothetical protein
MPLLYTPYILLLLFNMWCCGLIRTSHMVLLLVMPAYPLH